MRIEAAIWQQADLRHQFLLINIPQRGVQRDRKLDVLLYRQPIEQRHLLKNDAIQILLANRASLKAAHGNRAGLQRLQVREQREQRAFSAAGRADERDEFPFANGERNAIQHAQRASLRRIFMRHIADVNHKRIAVRRFKSV